MQAEWSGLDRYYTAALQVEDSALNSALSANAAAGLPAQDVSPLQGRFLHILARLMQAKRVLEIGTLGGYSTIWLARALPPGGRVVTLEANPAHADTARANLAAAGVAEKVELREGPALDSLPLLAGGEPFDLIFIDADKPNNPAYLEWA
ncbi:class I SAM-dependent methyltransferase [Chromobacterium haemolyticum]|nr:class I SAM-dependent methyltransferase [Chromobacterium haemolyticum]